MTSLKSLMDRRSTQVLDLRDMKNLKGGRGADKNHSKNGNGGGGCPPDLDED